MKNHLIQTEEPTKCAVLGRIDGELHAQVYSGINGQVIADCPAKRRFANPVHIAIGPKLLAVVDRFEDYDLIRVTDHRFGAEEGDEDPPWEAIEDIRTYPVDKRCLGLFISEIGYIAATFQDEEGRTGLGISSGTNPNLDRMFPLDEKPTGPPCVIDTVELRDHLSLLLPCGDLIVGMDVHSELVRTRYLGIPEGWNCTQVAAAGNAIIGLCTRGDESRLYFWRQKVATALGDPIQTENSSEFKLERPFQPEYPLPPRLQGVRTEDFDHYLEELQNYEENIDKWALDEEDAPLHRSTHATTQQASSQGYVRPFTYKEADEIKFIDGRGATLAEVWMRKKDKDSPGLELNEPPIRFYRGDTYTQTGVSGFALVCAEEDEEEKTKVSGESDGIEIDSFSMTFSAEPGKSPELPFVGVRLVDYKTGENVFRHSKPLGWRVKGGEYPSPSVYLDENDEALKLDEEDYVSPTLCTYLNNLLASKLDGLDRKDGEDEERWSIEGRDKREWSVDYLAEEPNLETIFEDNEDDKDYPYNFLVRSARKRPKIKFKVDENERWITKREDDSYKPGWNWYEHNGRSVEVKSKLNVEEDWGMHLPVKSNAGGIGNFESGHFISENSTVSFFVPKLRQIKSFNEKNEPFYELPAAVKDNVYVMDQENLPKERGKDLTDEDLEGPYVKYDNETILVDCHPLTLLDINLSLEGYPQNRWEPPWVVREGGDQHIGTLYLSRESGMGHPRAYKWDYFDRFWTGSQQTIYENSISSTYFECEVKCYDDDGNEVEYQKIVNDLEPSLFPSELRDKAGRYLGNSSYGPLTFRFCAFADKRVKTVVWDWKVYWTGENWSCINDTFLSLYNEPYYTSESGILGGPYMGQNTIPNAFAVAGGHYMGTSTSGRSAPLKWDKLAYSGTVKFEVEEDPYKEKKILMGREITVQASFTPPYFLFHHYIPMGPGYKPSGRDKDTYG